MGWDTISSNDDAYNKWEAYGSKTTLAANLEDYEKKLKENGTTPIPAGSGSPSVFGNGFAAN